MPQSEKFEHYELLKNQDGSFAELGHGAMGVTYKAFDTSLRCTVALKVISAAHLDDPTAHERFLREARGAAQLRHRNVASVFHLGTSGDSFFYAMEFIEGETVDARVKREGPLPALVALDIASQVAAALIAAAKQGLIHRDIKPSNIMLVLEDDGELIAKVIDFGLVKSALVSSSAGALTSSGFVGTPYFASPEQLDQRSEDIRSDIYSLGVTLWFMLTGKPTFMGSVASVIAQHLDKPPAFETLAVLPTPAVNVLRKMLEKDVDARIQSPQELRAELKRAIEIMQDVGRAPEQQPATMTFDEASKTLGLTTPPAAQPQPHAGSVLSSRYQLIDDLDPAHPGRNFHAEDITQKRRVRVKIVQCQAAAFSAMREQAAQVEGTVHPNFISVLAVERTGSLGYVVSEWLEGFSLCDLLRARRELTLRETLSLLSQIAPAVDAARDLGVRLALELRDVLIHFPEGFEEPNEQVILRCPIAEWPVFVVKLDPLGGLDEIDELNGSAERTMIGARDSMRPMAIAQLASIAYELLGGKPGASGPLANVSEEGNLVLRAALSRYDHFTSAHDFVSQISATTDHTMRATQPMAPLDPASAAAAVPVPRSAPPVEKTLPPVPARSGPPSSRVKPPVRLSEADTARPRPSTNYWPVIGGVGGLVAVLVGGAFFFSNGKNASQNPSATPALTPTNSPAAIAPRQPPQPGRPWKNGLGMTYVPLGPIWFAATETRVRDFAAFVQETNYDAVGGMDSLQKDGYKDHGHSWKDPGFKQSPEHPVVGISREDANFFCKWLTDKERSAGALTAAQFYRLPTDREWSEAVGLPAETGATPEERSGRIKNLYPWGHMFPPPEDAGNYAGSESTAGAPSKWPVIPNYHDPFPRTGPVPVSAANERGIYDLGGNVWQWCGDSFGKSNPRWGVLRGGSWSTSRPEEMLSSYRKDLDPTFREDNVGFRCVIATDAGIR
ncbi:serine/threonine protein kinase [Chthoniobacter flavus Ellin428]|uniref:Serine/threonine protein kinase n=1 Tax=Chthoniobacter flavus Ellin428 TaxID=497964 RepID=B4CYY7_9BACT|nr:protein kinase [Chthoniobacter flavus]EDY20678.1 serine/threonine protein kinase [Chthoniobacter flavus Ellin428]TCO89577.1 serine/threonine protein kinase [Chthoniobacter flavus]